MTDDCCAHLRARPRRRAARTARWLVGPGLLLALAPKCPLCVAAYLSAIGVGAGTAAAVAPWLRPLAIAVVVLIAVAAGAIWYRESARDRRASRA